ncbi:hypothetical protein Dsin_019926 [Dipteronia sinensis]|uniref:RNase H type-1 domain-containing protein n=1 Tax=Dipteronia sinensis TaxID=43782 RepID=A0AAE0A8H6_9ROSI|nr:hypothetical protein Dsin_019926 [Dipteronia sinensis]
MWRILLGRLPTEDSLAKAGILHAFEAELSAVINAIEYAFDFGWHNLWIECESSYMVSLLSCRSPNVPWRFLSFWKRCLVYLTSMKIFVSHIFREDTGHMFCSPMPPEASARGGDSTLAGGGDLWETV